MEKPKGEPRCQQYESSHPKKYRPSRARAREFARSPKNCTYGFLSDYEVGDYGEVELDEEDKRLTVRNRLKAAAGRREVGIEFRRTQGDIIRCRVVARGVSNGKKAPAFVS